MKTDLLSTVTLILLLQVMPLAASEPDESFRVVSWNVSGDSFVTHSVSFRAVMNYTRPDVLLLDEVFPGTGEAALQQVLFAVDPAGSTPWNIDIGVSGGRQRGVIASRWPLEALPEFALVQAYPEKPRQRLEGRMAPEDLLPTRYGMDGGIPVNGSVIHIGQKKLLVVTLDLQCCGGAYDDWQEYRRRIEAREIRRLINRIISKRRIDAVVLAGDFNAVATPVPRLLASGRYRIPQSYLRAVEIYHIDGVTDWTWDGRGTPFASSALDGQYFSRHSLLLRAAYIFDSEDLDSQTLAEFGMQANTSVVLSDHRPLVVDYSWRTGESAQDLAQSANNR